MGAKAGCYGSLPELVLPESVGSCDVGDLEKELESVVDLIDPAEVHAEEQRTQHNLRAVVHVLQRLLPEPVRHLVHLGATSFDVQDTAVALRMADVVRVVIMPLLLLLRRCLLTL